MCQIVSISNNKTQRRRKTQGQICLLLFILHASVGTVLSVNFQPSKRPSPIASPIALSKTPFLRLDENFTPSSLSDLSDVYWVVSVVVPAATCRPVASFTTSSAHSFGIASTHRSILRSRRILRSDVRKSLLSARLQGVFPPTVTIWDCSR